MPIEFPVVLPIIELAIELSIGLPAFQMSFSLLLRTFSTPFGRLLSDTALPRGIMHEQK